MARQTDTEEEKVSYGVALLLKKRQRGGYLN